MARGVLVGIDVGTTRLKMCAFDAGSGRLLARAVENVAVDSWPDGRYEVKLPALDKSLRRIVEAVRAELGDRWNRVEGIGLAAQGGSTIIADRATGRPLTPMILWNDSRGRPYTDRVLERFPLRHWRRVALREAPPAGLPRLLWLKEHRPKLFTSENIHIGAGEYVFFQLTGTWRQEAGSAIQIGLYNAVTQRLDARPLAMVDQSSGFVAPLRIGHEPVPLSARGARTFGLSEGIPVAGPYIDQEAGYLSAAAASGRPLQLSLGTAWVGNFVLPETVAGSSPTQLALPSPTESGRLIIQPLSTGNRGWDWALERFLPDEADRYGAAAAVFRRALLPPDGLCVVPWFTLPNPLFPEAHGGAAFWGVSAQTETHDLLRGVAAGMSFELARMFSTVRAAEVVDGVIVTGGAGQAAYFRSLMAALFSPLPVHIQRDEDLAVVRGALHAFGGKAVAGRLQKVSAPKASHHEAIRKSYERYLTVFDQLYGSVSIGRPFHVEARLS